MPETEHLHQLLGKKLREPDQNLSTFKTVYEHLQDPTKLILRAEYPAGWVAEYPGGEYFTREEQRNYFLLHYKVRHLLHILLPHQFPDCYGADAKTLIVQKIEGQQVDWESLSDDVRELWLLPMSEVGLRIRNLDFGHNFILTNKNRLYYVDDIVDFAYFERLALIRRSEKASKPLPRLYLPGVKVDRISTGPRYFNATRVREYIEQGDLEWNRSLIQPITFEDKQEALKLVHEIQFLTDQFRPVSLVDVWAAKY